MRFTEMLETVTETLDAVAEYVARARLARAMDTDDALLLANRQLRRVVAERETVEKRRAA